MSFSDPMKNLRADGYTQIDMDDLNFIYELSALPIDQVCGDRRCPDRHTSVLITMRYVSVGTVRKHNLKEIYLMGNMESFLTTTSFNVNVEQLDEILAALLKAALLLRAAKDEVSMVEPHKDEL